MEYTAMTHQMEVVYWIMVMWTAFASCMAIGWVIAQLQFKLVRKYFRRQRVKRRIREIQASRTPLKI